MPGPEPDDIFENASPLDFRYKDPQARKFTSENAAIDYQKRVEVALVGTLEDRGIAPEGVNQEIETACNDVTTKEVYDEEGKVRHNIRALVNCIQRRVTLRARPFVHRIATSYDIIDPANIARYKDLTLGVTIPSLTKLEGVLIDLAIGDADTLQIGRTHGQHAVPITFGFAIAQYVSRLGGSIVHMRALVDELEGKFSGAAGAYNATSLLIDDPENFEAEVLAKMGLKPAEISTQIVPPEPAIRLVGEYVISLGVMANLADDMRNLQRTEIGEVGEKFEENQVGSSTMPQKQNPLNFENSKGIWKKVMPGLVTLYMNQISEHQRDLTGSSGDRWTYEMMELVVSVTKRMTRTMGGLQVNKANMLRNFRMTGDQVNAEAYHILLATQGHPDSHEVMRRLSLEARRKEVPVWDLAFADPDLRPYLNRMSVNQRAILADPSKYVGIAAQKARAVAQNWKARLNI